MTIQDAISAVDELKPNMYGVKDKIRWLSRLDARIWEEIISTHEYADDEEEIDKPSYSEDDTSVELLVGEPYDEIYRHWLSAQIDYNNMEYDSFNNSNAMFESMYTSFRNAYNRSHMPTGEAKIYF